MGRVFELGLDYIQDNRDPILVVVSYDALMGVRSVGGNNAVALACILGSLVSLAKLDDSWVHIEEGLWSRLLGGEYWIRGETTRVVVWRGLRLGPH